MRGLFAFGTAAAIATLGSETAEAAPTPVLKNPAAGGEAQRQESDYREDVDGAPKTEDAQYYYYRRPRRRVYYRRRVYRPRYRRVYYRPRYRRVRYYRPVYRRPVYYFW
ncbi:MAG: hypothetical protein ACRC7C_01645 [Beijerinckiaceae bacterium]